MADITTKDAVEMAYNGNAAGFKDAVNDLLMDKIRDAVDIQRHEVAASFLQPEEQQEVETNED